MKKLPDNERKNNVAFRISRDEYKRLKQLANKLNLTFSDLIRESIKKYETTLQK